MTVLHQFKDLLYLQRGNFCWREGWYGRYKQNIVDDSMCELLRTKYNAACRYSFNAHHKWHLPTRHEDLRFNYLLNLVVLCYHLLSPCAHYSFLSTKTMFVSKTGAVLGMHTIWNQVDVKPKAVLDPPRISSLQLVSMVNEYKNQKMMHFSFVIF